MIGLHHEGRRAKRGDVVRASPAPQILNPSRAGKSDHWYTSTKWAQRIRNALGGTIDLDPCAADPRLDAIRAARSCVFPASDGLRAKWKGTVYVNPPYSRMKEWHAKILEEQQRCERVLVLVPLRPSSRWWRELAAQADFIGVPASRISFVDGVTGVLQGTGRVDLTFFGWRLADPRALGVMTFNLTNVRQMEMFL